MAHRLFDLIVASPGSELVAGARELILPSGLFLHELRRTESYMLNAVGAKPTSLRVATFRGYWADPNKNSDERLHYDVEANLALTARGYNSLWRAAERYGANPRFSAMLRFCEDR